MNKSNNSKGFTLIELLVAISIAGILTAMGAPSLHKTLQDNSMTALHNEVLAALSFARSAAITQGSHVAFCKRKLASDGCASPTDSWQHGWLVFSDKNNDGTIDAGEAILSVKSDVPEGIAILYSRNKNRISYGAEGYAISYNGNITFCDSRGDAAKKGMIISNNGRIRVATASDKLSNCP